VSIATHECIDTGSRSGDLLWVLMRWTFDNAFVYEMTRKFSSMPEAEAQCLALIPDIELIVLESARNEAAQLVYQPIPGQVDEEVTPDYPDELPEFDADVSVDTRRRNFHRWLLRFCWPLELLEMSRYFLAVWTWIDQMTGPNARTYLAIDVATFNDVSARMGTALTVKELDDADVPGEIP
jgi:hypothetical protein